MVATLSYGTSVNKFGLHGGLSYTSNLNPAEGALYGDSNTDGGGSVANALSGSVAEFYLPKLTSTL